jgi:hypothetical protein
VSSHERFSIQLKINTIASMDNSQSTRPASQLIAGFASPSTPTSAPQQSMRHSTRIFQPQAPSHQPVHGQTYRSISMAAMMNV